MHANYSWVLKPIFHVLTSWLHLRQDVCIIRKTTQYPSSCMLIKFPLCANKKNGINSRLFLFVMMKLSFETLFSPLSTFYVFIRDKSAIMFSLFEIFLVIYYSISFRFLLMTLQPSDVSLSHTYLKFSI